MLRLTQAPNIAIATLWADLLTEAGLEATVQEGVLTLGNSSHSVDIECLRWR